MFGGGGGVGVLLFVHSAPAYEAIEVVYEECREADDDRDIAFVAERGHDPEHDEHYVVCGIGGWMKRTAPEGEIDGEKARGDRNRARDEVCCAEVLQDEIKSDRDRRRKQEHQRRFGFAYAVDLDLGALARIGVAQPRYQGEKRHRGGHAEIGRHLAVVCE